MTMTLFRRINDILTANLNDLVDHFEDPEKMLRQAIREMDEAIATTTSAAARSIASQKLIGKEIESRREQSARWTSNAAAAVASGDDDRARRALMRRREQERLIAALEEQSAAATDVSTRLRRRIAATKVKRAEASRMLIEFAARQSLVIANRRERIICDAATDVFHRFERLRQRIELAEAETDAALELAGDDWLTEHDRDETEAVEIELLELKQGTSRQ
jgi:phage shock protein A